MRSDISGRHSGRQAFAADLHVYVSGVPKEGFEPSPPEGDWTLNPARLPFRHFGLCGLVCQDGLHLCDRLTDDRGAARGVNISAATLRAEARFASSRRNPPRGRGLQEGSYPVGSGSGPPTEDKREWVSSSFPEAPGTPSLTLISGNRNDHKILLSNSIAAPTYPKMLWLSSPKNLPA